MFYRTYLPPCGFPAGDYWNPQNIPGYIAANLQSIESNPQDILNCLIDYIDSYKFDNVAFTMGDDFAYELAEETFQYSETLQRFFSEITDYFEFKFSTVGDYYDAMRFEQS